MSNLNIDSLSGSVKKRETSVHRILNGTIHEYPAWYYQSKQRAKKEGICFYCGNEVSNKRSTFCSDLCKKHWLNWASIKSLRVNSVRREVHKKFHFACTECGVMFFQELDSGIMIPRFYGQVHHVVPLCFGGLDSFDNLTLLCEQCHKSVHKKQ